MHEVNCVYTQDLCVIKMTHKEQFLMDSAVSTHGQNEEATITNRQFYLGNVLSL